MYFEYSSGLTVYTFISRERSRLMKNSGKERFI